MRYKNGDKEAFNILINSNLRLVVNVASRYKQKCFNTSLDFMDLIQEGNIGLQLAIEKYDINKTCKLSTYAYYWIRLYICMSLINSRNVKLPVYKANYLDAMERYKYEFMSKYGREPQVCDYENDLNIPRNLIESIRFENYKLVSLDHTIGEFDQIPFSDIVMDTNFDFYDIDNYLDGKEILLHMKDYLPSRTYNIILMKLGIKDGKYGSDSEMSYKLIGDKYGLSKERISKIAREGFTRIRRINIKKK